MRFRNPFSRQPLSHQDFEAWGKSIRLGAKRAEDERRKGDPEAGKDSHYCKLRSQMLLDLKGVGKASKSRNERVHKHVAAYLKMQMRAGRFTESDVHRALGGLRAHGGENFDVVALAQVLDPILKLTDPTLLQPLKQAVAVQAAAARKALSTLEAGPQAQQAGENKARFAAAPSAKEKKAADKQLAISYDNAWSAAEPFLKAIDAMAGMPNPNNADTLCDRFNEIFKAWPVSSELRMDSLPQDLLNKNWAELIEMRHQLDLLMKKSDQRGHEPEFHDEARQQARELQQKSADYIRALVSVGELLTHSPRYGTYPAHREPIMRFGHALVDFANAMLDPGSEFVETYQQAEKIAALAQTRKKAAQAALVEEKKAEAAQAAKAQQQAAQQDKAQALISQRLDAIHQLGELASESYVAFDVYLDPEHEDEDGKKLRQELIRLLAEDPRTKGLELDSLHDTLFADKPDELEDMLNDLEAAVTQWQEASDADRLTSAQRVCELSTAVKLGIDAYLDQFDAVSQLLKRRFPELDLSSEVESRRQAAARLMADYVNGLEYSEGSWAKNMEYARAMYGAARADVNRLESMAVVEDVQNESGLDAERSLPSTPRTPLSSSTREADLVPKLRMRVIGRHREAMPPAPRVHALENRAFADVMEMADEFIKELEENAKADAAIRQKADSGLVGMSPQELAHMLNLSTPPLTPRPGSGLDSDLSPNALPRLPLRRGARFNQVDGASGQFR